MELYAVNITKNFNNILQEMLLSYIDNKKRNKLSKYKHKEDMIRALSADVLIRSIVCRKFKINNAELFYEYNIYGKPRINLDNNFCFNVSHSGNWVVAAVDDQQIGIDIEEVKSTEYEDISQEFFTKGEYMWLLSQNNAERNEAFYKLWTVKESYVKMVGKGLTIPLNSFCIDFDLGDIICIKDVINSKIQATSKIIKFDKNYVLSICSSKKDFKIKTKFIDYNEIIYQIAKK